MNTILIIIIICLLLQITGFFKRLMRLCKLDYIPEKSNISQQEKAPAPPPILDTLERAKMEQIAANIILYNGYKKDAFKLVKTLTTAQLIDIINDFKNDMEL